MSQTAKIELPVYLNSARQNLLFIADLPIKEGQKIHEFHERGVAIIASSLLSINLLVFDKYLVQLSPIFNQTAQAQIFIL